MITIGIDGNEANVPNRVGSNHYAYGILKGLHSLKPQDTRFVIYLKNKPLPDMPEPNKNWKYRVLPPTPAWTQWRLPLDLYKPWGRPQVFFSPGHYAPRYSPVPTVVSIMDLAFLKMPQLFLKFKRGTKQLADWTQYSVKQSTALIAISEHTKQDIVGAYGISPNNIHIAYPGVDSTSFKRPSSQKIKEVQEKYRLPDKYILHMGTIQPRKNITRLINAFEQLPPKFKSYSLVLAGQKGWLTEEVDEAIAKSPKKDKIIQTGFIDQVDAPAIMANAGCLCLVGLYEGFGMPPAEAFACGTVPVVSNNTSLPEVVGEAGIQVDPYSISSIKNGISIALSEPEEKRNKRIELGKTHIKQFNWTESAKIVLKVLLDIVQK